MEKGETCPRPWEVLEQAGDYDDVITHDLTAGCLSNMQFHRTSYRLDLVCAPGKNGK